MRNNKSYNLSKKTIFYLSSEKNKNITLLISTSYIGCILLICYLMYPFLYF